MYRQHESPYKLENRLAEAKAEYRKAVEENASEEDLISLYENILDLEERVNFAWQDYNE